MKDCCLNMDELLEQNIWLDEDGNYLPIWDIPNKKIFQIEKKLKRAISAGASDYVKKWHQMFIEEAELRRSMKQDDYPSLSEYFE